MSNKFDEKRYTRDSKTSRIAFTPLMIDSSVLYLQARNPDMVRLENALDVLGPSPVVVLV